MQLATQPRALEVDFSKAAIVVVDMQNAFASKGGMLDIAGVDISGAGPAIARSKLVLAAARAAHVLVVYLQMGYKPDLSDSGGPGAPNWHKELALRMMEERQPLRGKLLVDGTWDFAVVDDLPPLAGDLVMVKTRYSGFARTGLEQELRSRGIEYLFFAGLTSNVCVESTLRHAFMLDFWPILIKDATAQAGPPVLHESTVFNVETFFGWSIGAAELVAALRR